MRAVLLLGVMLRGWWFLLSVLAVFSTVVLLLGGRAFIDTGAAGALVMCCAGTFVGVGTANLRNWSGATLVPGYGRGLFAATLVLLVVALSAWAAVGVLAGYRVPMPGFPFLIGSIITLCLVPLRHSAQPVAALIFFLPVLMTGSVLALGARTGWHDGGYEALAKPSVQAASVAVAGLALWMLWRVIDSPISTAPPRPPATRSIPVQPSGMPVTPLIHRQPGHWLKVVAGTAALVGLALLLRLSDATPFWSMMGFMVPWGSLMVYGGIFQLHHVHAVFHFLWLLNVADSRVDVARRGAVVILLRAFAWLPAGLAGAVILAFGKEDHGALLGGVLLSQTLVLVMVAICLVGVSRLPIGWTRMNWLYSSSSGVLGAVILGSWWARMELAALGYWVPVLAVVGSADVAALLATRVLSRAEVMA